MFSAYEPFLFFFLGGGSLRAVKLGSRALLELASHLSDGLGAVNSVARMRGRDFLVVEVARLVAS